MTKKTLDFYFKQARVQTVKTFVKTGATFLLGVATVARDPVIACSVSLEGVTTAVNITIVSGRVPKMVCIAQTLSLLLPQVLILDTLDHF